MNGKGGMENSVLSYRKKLRMVLLFKNTPSLSSNEKHPNLQLRVDIQIWKLIVIFALASQISSFRDQYGNLCIFLWWYLDRNFLDNILWSQFKRCQSSNTFNVYRCRLLRTSQRNNPLDFSRNMHLQNEFSFHLE